MHFYHHVMLVLSFLSAKTSCSIHPIPYFPARNWSQADWAIHLYYSWIYCFPAARATNLCLAKMADCASLSRHWLRHSLSWSATSSPPPPHPQSRWHSSGDWYLHLFGSILGRNQAPTLAHFELSKWLGQPRFVAFFSRTAPHGHQLCLWL